MRKSAKKGDGAPKRARKSKKEPTVTIKAEYPKTEDISKEENQSDSESCASYPPVLSKTISKRTKKTAGGSQGGPLAPFAPRITTKQRASEALKVSEGFFCKKHNSKIEWICTNPLCFSEICGHCMLEHQSHISSIRSLADVFASAISSVSLQSLPEIREEIIKTQKMNLNQLEDLSSRLKDLVSKRSASLREAIVSNDDKLLGTLEELQALSQIIKTSSPDDQISEKYFGLLKTFLMFEYQYSNPKICPFLTFLKVDFTSLKANLCESFSKNAIVLEDGLFLESTLPHYPKLLHWFEWGRKRLNVYDIVRNVTEMIDLEIDFKVPSFSRSIVLPTAQIFIMGGEEPEYYSKKEVYMYDYVLNDKKLTQMASMPSKKFDFTLCYCKPCIYVLCGKDASSEVVNSCEKFNVETNTWSTIAPAFKKRYAASATGVNNSRIFLFGGRSDLNNAMVEEIEEYDSGTNTWKVVALANPEMWNPVEVCACIQIKYDEVLIFGGSDKFIKDSERCFVLTLKDYSLRKTSDLKRAQVFVASPFLYGNKVYAIGNEYYMKSRNLHSFSMETHEWNIIF